MRWRIPLLLTLVAFVAVSCDQQPIEPQEQSVVTSPTFDFSNGPPEPGNSYIVRGEYGGFAWFATDPKTELGVLVASDDFDCYLFDGDPTLVPWQNIFNPSGEGLEMWFENGWLHAMILEPPYECDDVLATGLVHNQWTDNDVYAWMYEHNRANAYGGVISGRVGEYSVSWVTRCVWGGLTKEEFNNDHCNIKVQVH